MFYRNGERVKIRDRVRMDGSIGTVVCSIDDGEYSEAYPASAWSYLGKGVLFEFPKYGLIYYEAELDEDIEPLDRQ